MGRRIGFFAAIAREAARTQRQAARQAELQRRTERRKMIEVERLKRRSRIESEKILRQTVRDRERIAKQVYLDKRLEETEEKNEKIADRIDELKSILQHTLEVDDTISFNSLKKVEKYSSFQIPEDCKPAALIATPPIKDHFFKNACCFCSV